MIRLFALALCVSVQSGTQQEDKVKRKLEGPLAGLPSAAGPHIEKIRALGDNAWLNLGSPAPDPKWGKARGRSWSSRMPYAPDVRGAFLNGQGVHGFVKPDGYYMDDVFFYDVNAHRWICVYPGTDTRTIAAKFKSGEYKPNDDGQVVDKQGHPVPVLMVTGHSYGWHTYDTDRRTYVTLGGPGPEGWLGNSYDTPCFKEVQKHLPSPKGKDRVTGSPFFFDLASGRFQRYPIGRPHTYDFNSILLYLPTKKALWLSNRSQTLMYDVATHQGWSELKASGPAPDAYDTVACYDGKRDRIYVRSHVYDVKTNSWSVARHSGNVPRAYDHNAACMHYDSVNDQVVHVVFNNGSDPAAIKRGIFVLDPDTGAWTDGPLSVGGQTWNGFYSPELNAHFFHVATDSTGDGVVWVYRYRKARKK